MNRTEMQRIAAAVNRLRPDWRADSLETFIATNYSGHPYRDVAIAMTVIATDETTRTPQLVKQQGPWWTAVQVALRLPDPDGVTPAGRCPYHPGQPKQCPDCAEHQRTVITDPDHIRSIRQQAKEQQ
jgi:hypothetical protein